MGRAPKSTVGGLTCWSRPLHFPMNGGALLRMSLATVAASAALFDLKTFLSEEAGIDEAGVREYLPLLQANEVDEKALPILTDELLKVCGIIAVVDRAKILAARDKRVAALASVIQLNVSKERLEYILSPSLEQIKLPHNPYRTFAIAGPVDETKHYAIPGFLRDHVLQRQRIEELIRDGKYFVLHQQQQSGKTSYMLELRDYLNSQPDYTALYINVEKAQIGRADVATGVGLVLAELRRRSLLAFLTKARENKYAQFIGSFLLQ